MVQTFTVFADGLATKISSGVPGSIFTKVCTCEKFPLYDLSIAVTQSPPDHTLICTAIK